MPPQQGPDPRGQKAHRRRAELLAAKQSALKPEDRLANRQLDLEIFQRPKVSPLTSYHERLQLESFVGLAVNPNTGPICETENEDRSFFAPGNPPLHRNDLHKYLGALAEVTTNLN